MDRQVDQARQKEMELCLSTEAKYIVQVVEGQQPKNVSFVWAHIVICSFQCHENSLQPASCKRGKRKREQAFRKKGNEKQGRWNQLYIHLSDSEKGHNQRKAISLPYLSVSFSTSTLTQPSSQSLSLCPSQRCFCPFDSLLFMLHNDTLRNLHPPSSPSSTSLPLCPFLSSSLSSSPHHLLPACPVSHFPPLSISLLQVGHHAVILAIGNGSWPQRMGDCKCSTDEILGGDRIV